MSEQERLSVWYEVSDDEDTPTDDDNASITGGVAADERDQLLPTVIVAPPLSRTILIGGSSTRSQSSSNRHAYGHVSSLPSSSGPRYEMDKAPLTCIDVTMMVFASLVMAVYGIAAYYAMHWRIIYASGVSTCSVALDVFLLVCAIHAAMMASLLLSYSSRALLSLCRGDGIAPCWESPSCTQRATETFLVIGALAQIALGVWGEAWVGPIGLLTAVVHPGTCAVSGVGSALFNASWYIATFEFAMMGMVMMYFLLWACSAAHSPSDDPTWLTVSSRGSNDASSGSGGNRAFSEQLRRTTTPPIIDGHGNTVSPSATGSNGASSSSNGRHDAAFRGTSHTLDDGSKRTRRERPNRSCS